MLVTTEMVATQTSPVAEGEGHVGTQEVMTPTPIFREACQPKHASLITGRNIPKINVHYLLNVYLAYSQQPLNYASYW